MSSLHQKTTLLLQTRPHLLREPFACQPSGIISGLHLVVQRQPWHQNRNMEVWIFAHRHPHVLVVWIILSIMSFSIFRLVSGGVSKFANECLKISLATFEATRNYAGILKNPEMLKPEPSHVPVPYPYGLDPPVITPTSTYIVSRIRQLCWEIELRPIDACEIWKKIKESTMFAKDCITSIILADGHTASNTPDLFRPPKLSGAGPG